MQIESFKTTRFPNLQTVGTSTIDAILDRFINPSQLTGLTRDERRLYDLALQGEIVKTLIASGRMTNEDLEKTNNLLPRNNWGFIVFKPPRASMTHEIYLENKLREYLRQYGLVCLGKYKLRSLTRELLTAMYPGEKEAVYWRDLEDQLTGLPAIYYLFESMESRLMDIRPSIELVKGWYKIDGSRGRYSAREGLRAIFRDLVTAQEGSFPERPKGGSLYEDSGIHAPCSLPGRYSQLIGFMGCDAEGAKWARSCLPWLNNAMSGVND